MNLHRFLKVYLVIFLAAECFSWSSAEDPVDSPLIKEVEQKKALYYNRKPPQGKHVVLVPKKQPLKTRKVVPGTNASKPSSNNNNISNNNGGGGTGVGAPIPRAQAQGQALVRKGAGPMRVAGSGPVPTLQKDLKENVRKASSNPAATSTNTNAAGDNPSTNENGEPEAASSTAQKRTFFPPYKYPFWGMPYGIYSNGGFINPGLFPFVPGGPGFPPYDGIFGSPFGPGLFPGKQNPIPPGVGTPMVPGASGQPPPVPPAMLGQPPLNPTGNRRGPPPGAYSPGSPVGYRRPKPKPPKAKPKPKPDDCPCNKGNDDDDYYYYPPVPSRRPSGKRPKKPTPCPCSRPKPSSLKKGRDADDDEDDYTSPPCPLAHEHDPPTTTNPPYVPPPPPPTYAPTEPPTTPVYAPPSPPRTKTKVCKLKHKIKYPTAPTFDDYTPPVAYPPTTSKKPCPLRPQKNVEYIYIATPDPTYPTTTPTTTTTSTTTTSPPPPPPTYQQQGVGGQPAPYTQAQAPPPAATYQQQQPQSTLTYQQQQQPQSTTTYQQVNQSTPQQQLTQATYQQPQTSTVYQQIQVPDTTYQQQQASVSPPTVVYSSSPAPGASGNSHSTILYKPIPQEIIQTPTSVTVPLPLPPFMIDEKGQLIQQSQQQSPQQQQQQQVTYKVDLNPDLLSKITTPVMIQSRNAGIIPIAISKNQSQQQLRQLTTSTGNHYIIDGQPITLTSSPTASIQQPQQVYPQSRVLIVDSLPTAASQVTPMAYASSVSQPSVVLLNSDPVYDYLQSQAQPQQSYIQPQTLTASATSSLPTYLSPSVQNIPDYSFLVPESPVNVRGRHHRKTPVMPPMHYPHRYSSPYDEYEEELQMPMRHRSRAPPPPQPQPNYNTKDYVIIDREELEELKRTLSAPEPLYEEKNLPPPPSVVHTDYHSMMEEMARERDEYNKPLAFTNNRNSPGLGNHRYDYNRNYDRDRGYREQQPQIHSNHKVPIFENGKDGAPTGTFSRIFDMNNEDIRGVEPLPKKKKKNRPLMVFDKYLENSEDADELEKK